MKRLAHIFFLLPIFAYGQSQILENYIKEGLSSNLALQQQNLVIEKSIKSINIARSDLFPRLTFSPTYTLAAGGRNIEFPIGDLLNPVYGTLNQLTQSSEFPSVQNENIQFAPNNFHETKVEFELPLFNSDIKYNVRLQRELIKTEEAKRAVLAYEIKYNIKAAYYQYLQSVEALKVYDQLGLFLNDFRAFNERLVTNQLALKDVLISTEMEQNKLERKRIEATKNIRSAKAYFNFLINKPFNEPIELDTTLFKTIPQSLDIAELQDLVIERRPEFRQLTAGKTVNSTLLQMQEKNAKLPSFYFGGSTGFQGFGYSFNQQAYAIGQIGMKWELFHGREKKHKIEQTKIQNKILDVKLLEAKQQIDMQITQAYFDYESALYDRKSLEGMVETGNSLVEFVNKKYKNQEALYFEVIKAQNDLTTAKLQLSLADFNIWHKKALLDKASGN